MIYERKSEAPLSLRLFGRRMAAHGGIALVLVLLSLLIGTAGYVVFAGLPWVDAFLNASMLLGGMGPVGEIATVPGKIFAALFALYSGIVFLVITAIVMAPVIHRVLHKFHWEAERDASRKP